MRQSSLTSTLADLNSTSSPSPVTQINGEDVVEFLLNEADRLTYHDPDTRWNALFYRQSAQSFGFFISPPWYPGPDTTISFENGTVQTYPNQAILRQPEYWSEIFDGESFYSTFVNLGVSWFKNRKARRDTTLKRPPRIPKRLQEIHQNPDDDGNADVPVGYPEPYLTGPSDTTLNAYFLDHPNPSIGNIGVLSLQTFDTDTDEGAAQFQALVQQFLAEAQNRGIDKIVIDLSSNAGGRVFLGYDTFLQVSYRLHHQDHHKLT